MAKGEIDSDFIMCGHRDSASKDCPGLEFSKEYVWKHANAGCLKSAFSAECEQKNGV